MIPSPELQTADDILAGLDPEQREVAAHPSGPMVVLAGAGTGKTRAITHRIAYGVRSGAYQPQRVLAVTFTARAAGGRVTDAVGEAGFVGEDAIPQFLGGDDVGGIVGHEDPDGSCGEQGRRHGPREPSARDMAGADWRLHGVHDSNGNETGHRRNHRSVSCRCGFDELGPPPDEQASPRPPAGEIRPVCL